MTDRERRELIQMASRWRRLAKRAAVLMTRINICSTSLLFTLAPAQKLPGLDTAYLTALRWDCRVGDDLRDLRDEIAAATQQTRKYNPPAQFRLLPA